MSDRAFPVVVVTNSGPSERLTACVDSLRRAGGAALIVVVDNSGGAVADHDWAGSCSDGVFEVEVVGATNDGYGAAVNRGVAVARRRAPDAVAIAALNDDVVVTSGWLAPLSDAVDAGCDVAQPKLLFASSAEAGAVVNSVGVYLDDACAGIDIGSGEPDGPRFDQPLDIDIFTGGAALYSTDFLDLTGGFDERYFLYYEDVDLALRGAEHGCRYQCVPSSVVWHEGGASTQALGDDTRRLQERNRLWCAARFASPGALGRALWLSVRRLRHHPRRTHASALFAGLAGLPVRLWERHRSHRALRGAA